MGFKMKYEIKKQYLTPNSLRRSGTKMPYVGFLVGHDTGNPGSTASGNVGYYERSRNVVSASAQIFVDDKEIIECIPFLTGTPEKAWHVIYNVTTDNRMYGDDANDIAGGVELCWGGAIDNEEAYKRYVWVLAYACYKFKLDPARDIVGHDVLDPARKIDPTNALKRLGKNNHLLRADVIAEYNDCLSKTVAKPAPVVSGSTYKIVAGDTLWGIANRTAGVSLQDILSWNPDVDAAALKVGQIIHLKKPTVKKEEPKKAPAKKPAAKPVAKKPKYKLPTKTLRRGDRGAEVLLLQKALCAAYFYPEKGAKDNGCDGSFGGKTENAVRRFQSAYANPVDGIPGKKTLAALDKLINK